MTGRKLIYRVCSWLIVLLVPVALALGAVRLMMTSAFLHFEYNLSSFPPDPYGFTKADRLYWSQYDVDYLLNSAGISFLGDLRFQDGSSVYNPRELSHMVDVKNTVKGALLVWYISLGILLVLGIWAWRGGWLDDYRLGLSRGGWLTAGLLVAILLYVIFNFNAIFVAFHKIFFESGTWMFEYSDTLIRLFPEKFWQDIFTYVGGLALAPHFIGGNGADPEFIRLLERLFPGFRY